MLKVGEIVAITHGRLVQGDGGTSVVDVGIDSRRVKKGGAFVAIHGVRQDGHRFIPQACAQEAAAVIVDHRPRRRIDPQVAVIQVKDTTAALGDLARSWRSRFEIPVIGVTGSAGKTTTKDLIAEALLPRWNVLKNTGSLNNYWGVPLTLLQLRRGHEAAVIEMGTNAPGEIEYLTRIVQPTIVVITNVGPAHLEGLGSLESVLKEKTSILKGLRPGGAIVMNRDDVLLRKYFTRRKVGRIVSYGLMERPDFLAEQVSLTLDGETEFRINRRYKMRLATPAVSNVSNAMAAVACARLLRVGFPKICEQLREFRFCQGRLDIDRLKGMVVINDTYNANPISYQGAVHTLARFPQANRRVAVCGDMRELGKFSDELHRQVGRQLAEAGVDAVFAYGPSTRIMAEAVQRYRPQAVVKHYTRMSALIRQVVMFSQPGDVVLVKGSRAMRMERVVEGFRAYFQ